MTYPFTNKDVSTTEKAVNYVQTANDEDFKIFSAWFLRGNQHWILPDGHREAVLAAITARTT